jgi:4-hydroxythreonine-4-phosphate dehydrogenase
VSDSSSHSAGDARPRIVFSIGDINGIGPEVLARALARPGTAAMFEPLIAGNRRLLEEYLDAIPSLPRTILTTRFVEIPSDARLALGRIDPAAGRLAHDAIVEATRSVLSGLADAIVTMPISKEAMIAGGSPFGGHTELIASITGGVPMMILMTAGMLVALATIHVPIAHVPGMLSVALVESRLRALHRTLRVDFAHARPRIALLGLNPHAGEHGLIGREEVDVIEPAAERLRAEGLDITGPLAADGFFARFSPGEYDGILAMYHDQGLIPLKLFAHGAGVNFTASLPVVRTSPDHGTAFDIAGRGIADDRSVLEAIGVAIEVARNRRAGV